MNMILFIAGTMAIAHTLCGAMYMSSRFAPDKDLREVLTLGYRFSFVVSICLYAVLFMVLHNLHLQGLTP